MSEDFVTTTRPRAIVVMGVCASGKSTLAARLAHQLDCTFLEGDAFHSDQAVAKMRSGEPLDDADRWPWLDRLGAAMGAAVNASGRVVAACSALKRSYRERLAHALDAPVGFVWLEVDEVELARRLDGRRGHYMPPALLASQLAALEPPGADEPALVLDGRRPPDELCEATRAWMRTALPASRRARR